MAGLNFQSARDQLLALDRCRPELYERLTLAFRQEMRHAGQVRVILAALGFKGKRELTQVMFWLQRTLTQTMIAFPLEHRPYLQILLNHMIEEKLARVGNRETYDALCAFCDPKIEVPAWAFYEMVAAEEPEHVKLDEDVIAIYAELYPQVSRDAAMKALRSRGLPFHRAIRAKREFVRAATAASSNP